MKKKTALFFGILGTLLVFGVAVALAQNNSSEKAEGAKNRECTPEMMENISGNCPEQMMQSNDCENMIKGAKGCGEMMDSSGASGNTETEKTSHCENRSDMNSMMGSEETAKRPMM